MTDVQVTPLVWSNQRTHIMNRTCWCKPKILQRWWNGQDLVIHKDAPDHSDGSGAAENRGSTTP